METFSFGGNLAAFKNELFEKIKTKLKREAIKCGYSVGAFNPAVAFDINLADIGFEEEFILPRIALIKHRI
jgi:hypothetical protein